MSDIELLKDDVFKLPIKYTEESCKDAIISRLDSYYEFICKSVNNVLLHTQVKSFKCCLSRMYDEYYMGHQNKAYNYFKEAIESILKYGGSGLKTVIPKECLYRARVNDSDVDYNNSEMFHISYNKRGKVATQRFSFPGLPCLYLGASSYVCWVELGRPNLSCFQVATIQQKNKDEDYKVIDLSIHPLAYYNELKANEEGCQSNEDLISIEDYLLLWPLIAACSIVVKNENDPFKPEYIFPQFVLQYILEDESDVVGIKYMSIKEGKISEEQYTVASRMYTNYVIPIRGLDTVDDWKCKILSDMFEIKTNMSGKELHLAKESLTDNGFYWGSFEDLSKKNNVLEEFIVLSNGTRIAYDKSEFYKIEKMLDVNTLNKLQ